MQDQHQPELTGPPPATPKVDGVGDVSQNATTPPPPADPAGAQA